MTNGDITLINTADELERRLLETEWQYITVSVGDSPPAHSALICPFCNAMVPPHRPDPPVDYKRHHIRYHVDMWRQIDRVKETSWP